MDLRREINEIIAIHQLEPTIKDLIVEGPEDACFFSLLFSPFTNHDFQIYTIDDINISNEEVTQFYKYVNNRGRIIALSNILMKAEIRSVVCIIDKDFDDLDNLDYENEILLYTDYSCIEMYAFYEPVITRFLTANFRSFPITVPLLLENISTLLISLFCIRYANYKLELNLKKLDFLKLCTLNSEKKIIFNLEDYIQRYLNKNKQLLKIKLFNSLVRDTLHLVNKDDMRHCINGHDFILLLHWYLDKTKANKPDRRYTPYTLWKALLLSINPVDLLRDRLFPNLLERLNVEFTYN